MVKIYRCYSAAIIRPPTMYSDAQWGVIVHHMRLRANITGQEQRAIVEFLKSAKVKADRSKRRINRAKRLQ